MPRISERFLDPEGKHFGIPTYPWRMAPEGLATRRQLATAGLRPGGAPVVAQIMWPRGGEQVGVAYLYDLTAAVPKRPFTAGLGRSVAAMLAARSTCGSCGTVYKYCLPKSQDCWRCQSGSGS
ncbi:RRQRL motif-containing zinc-binding protein [Catenulispora subtropica]|uniref:Uncharacterized protein n=1 Tax=Catenulispora subtropica TaxID=450798 RepID=A0ABP5BY64_9ACTN